MDNDILYTPEEIAAKLKISKYTVYEMIKRGDIDAHRIGRNLRISSAQLRKYMITTKGLTNIYNGTIIKENGDTYAQVDSVKICVNTDLSGDVKISIDPEDIILSKEVLSTSARNVKKGKVKKIIYEDTSVNVVLDIGISIIATITKKSLEELGIKEDIELYAIFKTMSVKVFRP